MSTFGGALWGNAGGAGASVPTGVPVSQYFYMALRLAHVTKFADAVQKAPSPDQLGDCLQQAQLMLSQASIKRYMVWAMRITDYVLGTAEKYTLGPNGTLVSTSGTSVRPVKIERAKLVLASTGLPVYLEVYRGSYDDFANLALQQIPGALPKFLYCDYAYPTANVYLVPQDQGGDTLELYDWTPMPALQTVNDLINLPPGYDDWFVNNLAVRLASIFEERGAWVSDDTRLEARKGEAFIMRQNNAAPKLTSDAPHSNSRRRGDFNYFDGMDK